MGRFHRLLRAGQVAWHWQVARTLAPPYLPAAVSIETTNRCNFRCSFCPQSRPEHAALNPVGALTPEQAGAMLDNLRAAGFDADQMSWTLDGEPFMNPRLGDIFDEAVARGFLHQNLASNGSRMTPARLRALPRASSYVILVDLCADATLFETHRGTRGSWAVVVEHLREALADPTLRHIRFHLGEISSLVCHDEAELAARRRALRALFPAAPNLSVYPVYHHDYLGRVSLPLGRMGGRAARYHVCPYPWSTVNVACNGDVVACCRDGERRTVLGNLLRQPFLEIWHGEPYQRLRRDLRDGHPERQAACAGCDLPYDPQRFGAANLLRTARMRLQLLD
jgi:radical SAM protein with 4Fe4S-binding SPASM domain